MLLNDASLQLWLSTGGPPRVAVSQQLGNRQMPNHRANLMLLLPTLQQAPSCKHRPRKRLLRPQKAAMDVPGTPSHKKLLAA
jgi:hypothetical protein